MTLILASQSKSRAELLKNAGLDLVCLPSHLDENLIKAEGHGVQQTGLKLAFAKADFISKENPDAYVIGADQMLSFGTMRLDKAADLAEVKKQLLSLRGQKHCLHSAVSVVQNQKELWSHIETAELEMRDFSNAFLEKYLDQKGPELLETVGCYRLESLGVQLFSKIDGDYFTILGLPLVPLLEFLRRQNIIES